MQIIEAVGPDQSRQSSFARHYDTNVTSRVLVRLCSYWTSKMDASGLPRLEDIDPVQMGPSLLPYIVLVDVERQRATQSEMRLRFRLVGTFVVDAVGRDNTGKYFDDCYPAERLDDMTFGLRWVVNNRAPMRSTGRADFAKKGWRELEFLLLPLVDESGAVARVMMGLDSRPVLPL